MMHIIRQLLCLLVLLSIIECRMKRRRKEKDRKRIDQEVKRATFQGGEVPLSENQKSGTFLAVEKNQSTGKAANGQPFHQLNYVVNNHIKLNLGVREQTPAGYYGDTRITRLHLKHH